MTTYLKEAKKLLSLSVSCKFKIKTFIWIFIVNEFHRIYQSIKVVSPNLLLHRQEVFCQTATKQIRSFYNSRKRNVKRAKQHNFLNKRNLFFFSKNRINRIDLLQWVLHRHNLPLLGSQSLIKPFYTDIKVFLKQTECLSDSSHIDLLSMVVTFYITFMRNDKSTSIFCKTSEIVLCFETTKWTLKRR